MPCEEDGTDWGRGKAAGFLMADGFAVLSGRL
jgi:hypothetical protein